MVRPPDDLQHGWSSVLLKGHENRLGDAGAAPLMSDAIAWGGLVFLSGRAAVDPATGAVRATTFAEQLQIVLDDTVMVLDQAGSGLDAVLRVECWLTDRRHFPEWNAAYARTFADPRPARTTLVVAGLPVEGLLVEIQLTAAVRA